MTDNDIIKALEWLILNFPKQIPAKDDTDRLCNCINLYCQNAVDELNRQKAEIEEQDQAIINALKRMGEIRAEAITEFAERLKPLVSGMVDVMWDSDMSKCRIGGCHKPSHIPCGSEICVEENRAEWMSEIDQIAKEMKEGVNNA